MTDSRWRVAAARRILYREGCDSKVAGHVSERVPGEDAFWVSPFGYFDETTPQMVIKSSFDLERLEGDWEPSPAISFHAEIYRARRDVKSVIHTHSHHVSVFATTRRTIGMYNDLSALFDGEQVLHEDDGTRPPVQGKDLARELGEDKHVVLIKNHGAVVAGDSLEDATILALSLELAARIHIEAEAIEGTEHAPAYVEHAKKAYQAWYLPMMWDANMRRLRRSDPDLFVDLEDHA